MTHVDVVGGVYREKCAFPHWDQLYGSAGRAAVALSGLGGGVRLYSSLSAKEEIAVRASFGAEGIDINLVPREWPIVFEYLHSLSVPRISPGHNPAHVAMPDVTGDVVIKFGMLESDPRVHAKHAIYDPQSAFAPLAFSRSGSRAEHLAIVANRAEVLHMTGAPTVQQAVSQLARGEGAEVVVVKNGLDGATVYTSETEGTIVPAFKSANVFSIGSGDVFVAAFASAWAVHRMPPLQAAKYASLSTAHYVETRSARLGTPEQTFAQRREAARKSGGRIYLAGPFRETGQRMLIDDARAHLSALGMNVFSPIHDIGPGEAEVVVRHDLAAIHECDAMFAILNGSSPGTVFEVGYARALGKPVFCVTQNMRSVDLKLPRGSECSLHDDYVSALFQIAWRS
jgi:Nucleoside 2-deoxyribosyltransferase/pfkB family carbohydrate kinase